MSTAMLFIGCFVLFWGAYRRFERMEDRANQLELMKRKQNHAKQWGLAEEEVERSNALKAAEHNNWKDVVKFECACWSLHILGALFLIVATAMWFHEKQNHSSAELANIVVIVSVFVLLGFNIIVADKRFERMEMEIAWLNHIFKVMYDHAENLKTGLVGRNMKLADRLDKLEKAHLLDEPSP